MAQAVFIVVGIPLGIGVFHLTNSGIIATGLRGLDLALGAVCWTVATVVVWSGSRHSWTAKRGVWRVIGGVSLVTSHLFIINTIFWSLYVVYMWFVTT